MIQNLKRRGGKNYNITWDNLLIYDSSVLTIKWHKDQFIKKKNVLEHTHFPGIFISIFFHTNIYRKDNYQTFENDLGWRIPPFRNLFMVP